MSEKESKTCYLFFYFPKQKMRLLFWRVLFEFKIHFAAFIIFILIVLWMKKRRKTEKVCQIQNFSSLPILRNVIFYFKYYEHNLGVYLIQNVEAACNLFLKKKMFKSSWAGHTYVVLYHPEVAQEVLKSYNVINKDWLYNILHSWLGTGLLTSSDEKWKKRRKLLTPAFHFRILEDFQDIFYEQSNILVEKLKQEKNNQLVEISELVTLCTLDIVGDSAMGIQLNAQVHSDNMYVRAVKDITTATIQWFVNPWYWFPPIFNLSQLGKKRRRDIKFVHDFARKVIKNKKEKLMEQLEENQSLDNFQESKEVLGIKKRRAFLDLLVYHHLTDGSLTEDDIREEVDTFMFEGHDTTSMGITWTLYLLGLHQDIQENVYQELYSIFSRDINRSINMEDLKNMKYLERVIKEALRLYPSVPYILRRNSEELKIGEYIIPRNSSLLLYIYGIHHNSEVFENPEVFDPGRFLPENCENRHPFAYLPFSAGPRNCIGQRFAMMVVKTVCANILRNFEIRSAEHRDKLLVSGDLILRPKEIKVYIKQR